MLPFGGLKPSPNPWLAEHYPAALLTMGLTAERVARHYQVSREDQDAFALASHQKALAAQAAGRFDEELVPVTVTSPVPGKKAGKPTVTETLFCGGRRSALGHFGRSACQAEAGLSCAGHGDGRELLADFGWRGGCCADGCRAREGAWVATPGAARGLCGYRLPAGGDGHWADHRHSQGAEDGRAEAG